MSPVTAISDELVDEHRARAAGKLDDARAELISAAKDLDVAGEPVAHQQVMFSLTALDDARQTLASQG